MAPATSASEQSLQPVYLTGKEAVWNTFPKAPSLGSPIDETDLGITISIQGLRTEEQKIEAKRDQQYSIKLVTDVIDSSFEKKYPKTWKVLLQADQDEHVINAMIKNENARPRPFIQHPILVTPLFPVRDFSYPSGHATGAELQALLLSQLFPARTEELLRRARQIADSRVVAGVHYTSDTEAGLALGDLLFHELEINSKFQAELARAMKMDQLPTK